MSNNETWIIEYSPMPGQWKPSESVRGFFRSQAAAEHMLLIVHQGDNSLYHARRIELAHEGVDRKMTQYKIESRSNSRDEWQACVGNLGGMYTYEEGLSQINAWIVRCGDERITRDQFRLVPMTAPAAAAPLPAWDQSDGVPGLDEVVGPTPPSAPDPWVQLVAHWSSQPSNTLPTDSAFRKEFPIDTGCLQYFPAAIACMALLSKIGNDKHNPGEPLHHARGKSNDHEDCQARHNMDKADARKSRDPFGELREATAAAWRACAIVQVLAEQIGAPLAPAARLPEGGRP